MNVIKWCKDHMNRLLTSPVRELGRWGRLLRFQLRFWRQCAGRLWADNVTAMSAALSFRTIFALIPALVLGLLVLKSLGILDDGKQSLREVLNRAGFYQIAVVQPQNQSSVETIDMPSKAASPPPADSSMPHNSDMPAVPAEESESHEIDVNFADFDAITVADEIERVVAEVERKLTVERLGPIGVALLIWTAVTLLMTIERSLNRIFGAARRRKIARSVILYWSVLTLGPLVLSVAILLSKRALAAVEHAPGSGWMLALSGWAGPPVVGVLVLASVYVLVPNTRVRFQSALSGALVAVPIWLLAKWAFSVYVTRFVGTGNLYGALGLLPLFMIWLNLSWLIFLFGAEIAHAAASMSAGSLDGPIEPVRLTARDHIAAVISVARHFADGRGPATLARIAADLNYPEETTLILLDRLESEKMISRIDEAEDASFLPARPAAAVDFAQILGLDDLPQTRSSTSETRFHHYSAHLEQAVGMTIERSRSALNSFTLEDALKSTKNDLTAPAPEIHADQ
jgi:membrane protein